MITVFNDPQALIERQNAIAALFMSLPVRSSTFEEQVSYCGRNARAPDYLQVSRLSHGERDTADHRLRQVKTTV
jgi:hypothetical protein